MGGFTLDRSICKHVVSCVLAVDWRKTQTVNISKSSKNPGREPASRHSIEHIRPHVNKSGDVTVSHLSLCFGILSGSSDYPLSFGLGDEVFDKLVGI